MVLKETKEPPNIGKNSMTTKVPFSSWVSLENYVRGIAKSTPLLFMC